MKSNSYISKMFSTQSLKNIGIASAGAVANEFREFSVIWLKKTVWRDKASEKINNKVDKVLHKNTGEIDARDEAHFTHYNDFPQNVHYHPIEDEFSTFELGDPMIYPYD